ncbi:hypothetical protein AC578_4870 [Pseudocercospora eumusae]|uniref:Uncharacterized protein n=1 Tax=Pseudocercospora eumusae TaxID=321146 RepID=A0A139HC88_9PEZI|nr:hypothetical protein AC578_4870 [Pseudocercospora eumusae]
MPILKLLNKLKSNEPIISTFMALGGFRHAQILAHTGLDATSPTSKPTNPSQQLHKPGTVPLSSASADRLLT